MHDYISFLCEKRAFAKKLIDTYNEFVNHNYIKQTDHPCEFFRGTFKTDDEIIKFVSEYFQILNINNIQVVSFNELEQRIANKFNLGLRYNYNIVIIQETDIPNYKQYCNKSWYIKDSQYIYLAIANTDKSKSGDIILLKGNCLYPSNLLNDFEISYAQLYNCLIDNKTYKNINPDITNFLIDLVNAVDSNVVNEYGNGYIDFELFNKKANQINTINITTKQENVSKYDLNLISVQFGELLGAMIVFKLFGISSDCKIEFPKSATNPLFDYVIYSNENDDFGIEFSQKKLEGGHHPSISTIFKQICDNANNLSGKEQTLFQYFIEPIMSMGNDISNNFVGWFELFRDFCYFCNVDLNLDDIDNFYKLATLRGTDIKTILNNLNNQDKQSIKTEYEKYLKLLSYDGDVDKVIKHGFNRFSLITPLSSFMCKEINKMYSKELTNLINEYTSGYQFHLGVNVTKSKGDFVIKYYWKMLRGANYKLDCGTSITMDKNYGIVRFSAH